ncbi:MAG: oligosaccharide flippase family protein [Candidatus Omnitrophica bacterium]|nr:oligosaccharide flippase family protein [Candidatus Omnitrophota bacterium]
MNTVSGNEKINNFGFFGRVETECATPPSLKKNFAWTLLGNLIYGSYQWLILIVLAKLGSAEIVGQFALAMAITTPIIIFTNLSLRGVQATDSKGQYGFGYYLILRLITSFLALILIYSVINFCGYVGQIKMVILIIGIAKGVESISDVFYGLFQQHEWMSRISKSMIIKGLSSLGVFILIFFVTRDLIWCSMGLVLTWLAVLVVYDVHGGIIILHLNNKCAYYVFLKNYFKGILHLSFKFKKIINLMLLALPLGITMLLSSLYVNIPRYFIEQLLGLKMLGIFSALYAIYGFGGVVINALGQSSLPRLANEYGKGNLTAFRKLLFKLVTIATIAGGIGILLVSFFGKGILFLFYGIEYAQQVNTFVLLMIAAALGYVGSFLGFGGLAAQYFKSYVPLLVVDISILALLCKYYIPYYRLEGVAIAIIITALIHVIGSLIIIRLVFNKRDL